MDSNIILRYVELKISKYVLRFEATNSPSVAPIRTLAVTVTLLYIRFGENVCCVCWYVVIFE